MIQDKNVINWAIMSMFLTELQQFLSKNGWLLALGVILTLVDLRFGIRASIYRKERVKLSRAVKRTCNKIVDYFCWIVLSYFIGETFGEVWSLVWLPYVIMGVIYIVEVESIATNYFEVKGKKLKTNIWELFGKKTGLEVKVKNKDEEFEEDTNINKEENNNKDEEL